MRSGTAFAFAGLYAVALQGVAATWRGEQPYGVPSNYDNKCTENESNGWDFNDLDDGDVPEYKGYGMSGWSCKSQPAKRNLEGRSFGEKCISTEAKHDDYSNEIKHDSNEFSVGHMDVSADEDTDVEFHYGMPDGSTCKKVARCGKDGSTVDNDQCGGAKSVKVKLPEGSEKKKCGVNIHSVKFECGSSTVPVPTPSATAPPSDDCTPPEGCGYGGDDSPECQLPESCTPETTAPPPETTPVETSPPAETTPGDDCSCPDGATCSLPAHCTESTPVESTPVETLPVEETTPVETSPPAETTPADDCTCPYGATCSLPASCTEETTPVESVPVETTPVETLPVEETTPVETTPVETAPPAETTPADDCTCPYGATCSLPASCTEETTPVESVPAESTPVETLPVEETTPVETAPPAETTPADDCTCPYGATCSLPASCTEETTPVESVPAESTPVETLPVEETTPVETTPVETAPPAETTPADDCTCPYGATCSLPASCTEETTPVESVPVESTPVETLPVEETTPPAEYTPPAGTGYSPPAPPAGTGYNPPAPPAGTGYYPPSPPAGTGYSPPAAGTGYNPPSPPSASGLTPPPTYGNSTNTPGKPGKPEVHAPPTDCPKTLPKCLNTWLHKSACKDNASPDCYCKEAEYVSKVSDCLFAYGQSKEETEKAVEYFLGLCQKHIPENPAIVTAIPPQVTLPPPSSGVPVTTIVRTVTTVVPCEPTTLVEGPSSGEVVTTTTSEVVKTVTIPRMTFTVTEGGEPALAYPTPDSPATAVPVGPAPTAVPNAPAGPTTLVTSGYASPTGAGSANNASAPVATSPPQFQGAASALSVGGFVSVAAAFAVVLFQF